MDVRLGRIGAKVLGEMELRDLTNPRQVSQKVEFDAGEAVAFKQRLSPHPNHIDGGGFARVAEDLRCCPPVFQRGDTFLSNQRTDRDAHAGIADYVNDAASEVVCVCRRLNSLRPFYRWPIAGFAKHPFQFLEPRFRDHNIATSLR